MRHRSNGIADGTRRFSPGFNPARVRGLTGWWKADRRDCLDQSAGGARALADNDPVGVWNSPAISLPGLTTGAGNRPPLKLSAAPNGRRMVYFDGVANLSTGDFFPLGPDGDYYTASARCGFLVVKPDSPANTAYLLRNGSTVRSAVQWLTSGPTVRFTITDSGGAKNCDVAVPAGTILILCWRHAGGKLYGSINGGTETEVTCGNQATTGNTINWPAAANDTKFKGHVGEFLLLNADPGVAYRNRIGRYLAGQWAGTWNRQT